MSSSQPNIVVVMPVFNDWIACRAVIAHLDSVLCSRYTSVTVLVVDDGSYPLSGLDQIPCVCVKPAILQLRRNLGHQRAICIGLAYVHDVIAPDFVVVMDSDGEDSPDDVPRLLDVAYSRPESVVFAKRVKRSESLLFRFCYLMFRVIHRLSTGHGIMFGNFSVIPMVRLKSLITVTDLWNNYAASVLVSRQPYCSLPTARATRIQGKPKMSFLSLVVHGLSAISVFGEVVAVRLASIGLIGLPLTALVLLLSVSGLLPLTEPMLAAVAVGVIASLQIASVGLLFAFLTLSRRNGFAFQPSRDYHHYVDAILNVEVASRVHGHERV